MTNTPAASGRVATVDLADIECEVRVVRPLVGAPYDLGWTPAPAGLSRIEAKAILHRSVEDSDEDESLVIARSYGYVVDLDLLANPVAAIDQIGAEVFFVAEHVFLPGDSIFDMLEEESEFGADLVSHVIIVESVSVEEPYRGQQLGPRLLTTMIDAVAGAGHETLIVLRAQPLQWEDLSELELSAARAKVAAAYEAVGFAHFREGIYWRHNAYVGAESMEVQAASMS